MVGQSAEIAPCFQQLRPQDSSPALQPCRRAAGLAGGQGARRGITREALGAAESVLTAAAGNSSPGDAGNQGHRLAIALRGVVSAAPGCEC
jgi:hypothetical protein